MTAPRDRSASSPDEASRPSIAPGGTAAAPGELWAGRIRVLGELGSGAMAEVLRGYDTKLRREVALKVTNNRTPGFMTAMVAVEYGMLGLLAGILGAILLAVSLPPCDRSNTSLPVVKALAETARFNWSAPASSCSSIRPAGQLPSTTTWCISSAHDFGPSGPKRLTFI